MSNQGYIDSAIDLITSGQYDDGIKILRKVLSTDQANITSLIWLGRAEFLMGNDQPAVQHLSKATLLAPGNVNALSHLGQALVDADEIALAKRTLKEAHRIDAAEPDVCFYLGLFSETDGDIVEAEKLYTQTLQGDPHNRQAYLQLAGCQNNLGKTFEALKTLQNAEKQFPDDRDITHTRGKLASLSIPGWHLPMLTDTSRNQSFERAIRETVRPGDIVLDIGTGSGLLAMMAAKAGAGHVYACEADPVLAQLALEIVVRNGVQDHVTIINKHSTDLIVGEDFPKKADVLITEIFDRALVGEEALPVFNHALEHLLTDDARLVPNKASLFGVLVECAGLPQHHKIEEVSGFDLSPMRLVARPLQNEDARISYWASKTSQILSRPFKIAEFDFCIQNQPEFETDVAIEIETAGTANALLFWFDLELSPGISISTKSNEQHHHWSQAFQTLLNNVDCRVGDRKSLKTRYAGYFDFLVEAGSN